MWATRAIKGRFIGVGKEIVRCVAHTQRVDTEKNKSSSSEPRRRNNKLESLRKRRKETDTRAFSGQSFLLFVFLLLVARLFYR